MKEEREGVQEDRNEVGYEMAKSNDGGVVDEGRGGGLEWGGSVCMGKERTVEPQHDH